MRIAQRIGIAVVTAALGAGSGLARAGVPPKRGADAPVDERLLEFLGSVDTSADSAKPDDGSWLAYLSQVNIGKVAQAAQLTQTPPTPAKQKAASAAAAAVKPGG